MEIHGNNIKWPKKKNDEKKMAEMQGTKIIYAQSTRTHFATNILVIVWIREILLIHLTESCWYSWCVFLNSFILCYICMVFRCVCRWISLFFHPGHTKCRESLKEYYPISWTVHTRMNSFVRTERVTTQPFASQNRLCAHTHAYDEFLLLVLLCRVI